MTSGAEEQAVRTKLLHREVNERILEVATGLFDVGEQERLWLVCECARLSCSERVELRPDAFREVLATPGRFVVLPGHEDSAVERVAERAEAYVLVEKPATIDPRQPGG